MIRVVVSACSELPVTQSWTEHHLIFLQHRVCLSFNHVMLSLQKPDILAQKLLKMFHATSSCSCAQS